MNDRDAVETAIRDYVEGWYSGDAERMARCLHDGLSKRTVAADDPSGSLHEVSKEQMLEFTAEGGGDDPDSTFEIVVHDVSAEMASGQVLSKEYMDYIHLARTQDGWKITNILFKTRDDTD